jgi:TRAP-type C4-dicarboxylate transport system permease small subunit
MNKLIETVDTVVRWLCHAVIYVTLSVVFVILTINVGLRYLAGTSLVWASEIPELMFPWLIMAGVVLAAQHGSHIAVVILTQKLGPLRRWVLAAGSVIVAGLYLSLAYAGLSVLEIAADEKSPIMQIPGSVNVGCLLGGFVLLAVVTLCRLPQVWRGTAHSDVGADA